MPSAIGPMARRLLLAIAILPPAAYGAHKAYQRFYGPEEERAKEATLRRYGLSKEALSPTVRNMLLGAGVGGIAGAGVNYALHHDKPDAGSRAARAGLGGALLGSIAGGVLTPERAASSVSHPASVPPVPTKPSHETTDDLISPLFAGAKEKILAETDKVLDKAHEVGARLRQEREARVHVEIRKPVVRDAYAKAYSRAMQDWGYGREDAHNYAAHISHMVDDAHQMPESVRNILQGMSHDEFHRLMQDPNHVWTF